MANGHSPDKPKGQGDFGKVHTSQPSDQSRNFEKDPGNGHHHEGYRSPGVGGSKKS